METLAEFNGNTGEAKIYSADTGALLFHGSIRTGPGDFELYQQLEAAIRRAEKETYNHTLRKAKDVVARALAGV